VAPLDQATRYLAAHVLLIASVVLLGWAAMTALRMAASFICAVSPSTPRQSAGAQARHAGARAAAARSTALIIIVTLGRRG